MNPPNKKGLMELVHVLRVVEREGSVKAASAKLGINHKTVEHHLTKLKRMAGLQSGSLMHLVAWGFRKGFLYVLLLVPLMAVGRPNKPLGLAWNAVPGVSVYAVKWGTKPGVYTQQSLTTMTSWSQTMTRGTTYYFAVYAVWSTNGVSVLRGPSNEIKWSPSP